jgi:hypothetical protein
MPPPRARRRSTPPWRAIIATGLLLVLLLVLAAAAAVDNAPRADVAAARAAWAGSGWAGAPRARETPNDADPQDGLQGVLELFDGALAAYLRHAYPKDNLKPLSCRGEDWQGGGMAVTLVDALDAFLVLPGRAHLLPLAVEALRRREEQGLAGVNATEEQGTAAAGEGRAAAAAAAGGGRAAAAAAPAYYGRDAKVHLFETTIRALGGLLSAHVLLSRLSPSEPLLQAPPPLANGSGPPSSSEAARALLAQAASSSSPSPTFSSSWRYDGLLLRLARDLADRMLPAFRTRSGIPLAWAHLRGAKHTAALPDNHATCTACAGTLLLEFGLLSRLTGDGRYRRVAERAAEALFARRSRLGLVGSELAVAMELRRGRGGKGGGGQDEEEDDDDDDGPRPHPHHANAASASSSPWTNAVSTIGPGSDSFYEYALKAFLATGERKRLDEFASLYAAVRALMAAPATPAVPSSSSSSPPLPPASFVLDVRMDDGRLAKPWVSSLGAFWPGLQALVGQVDDAAALQANFSAAAAAGSGWLPESFAADLSGAVHPHDPGWRLRPELVESAFLLHAATGDARHRDALAKPVLRSLRALLVPAATATATENTTTPSPQCEGALAHVADVRTGALEDSSESYLLSETLKYLALLLLPSGGGGNGNGGGGGGALVDAFVLTTEGHVALPEPWQGLGGGGGGASEADQDAADAAELAALARDGLLPTNSDDDPHTPPTCRALCASVGPAAALDGSERRAATAAAARLSSALPLVRATWREARRLRRRRCSACVAVARHLLAHPPEPAARRSCRLNFGGAPQRVAHAPAAASSLPPPLLPRPKPLRVPLPGAGRDAPPAHPATHHHPLPTAPEPLAAAVCHLDVGRWALGRGRLPLSCSRAHALGPLDLSTGQLPANAVVLQLSRVIVVEEEEAQKEEEQEEEGLGRGDQEKQRGGGGGDDAVLPSLRYALVVGFDGGDGGPAKRQVLTFAAAPAHFGPRPPLVASAACAARVLEPVFAPRSPSPCPALTPLLSPPPPSSRIARWLPDAELDNPSRPCGLAEVGAGVPMLAAPLALARPLHACDNGAAPSSPPPPPTMLRGSVAVVERGGGCSFVDKVLEAQRQGAAAVVVLNTHRAAMAAAREEEEERLRQQQQQQQQQQAGASANSCPSSSSSSDASTLAPPPLRPHHPTAMADDAWRAGERPRVPSVMLSPEDSARLLRLMGERGAGAATVVAAHGAAAAEGLRLIDAAERRRQQALDALAEEEEKEDKGDYGDDDEDKEKDDAAPAPRPPPPPPPPPGTWLALDRLLRTKLTRERVDLIVPPSSTEFVQRALLLPLQREKERWEAAVAALLGGGGGRGGGLGARSSLLLGSWAAAALPPPPLDAQAAFAQLATDPLARRVLQAGREQTLREESAAAEGVREAAKQQAAARRQGRIRRELGV